MSPVVRVLHNGNGFLERVRVFRTGTFRDSLGLQHTWDADHLRQMVRNFHNLRSRGVFPNVPVRADHSSSVNSLVGYIVDLQVDDAGGFLMADLEITEPSAVERLRRGTYRARSLEIGAYETNDESVYWPTVMGLAFVDIPAVEGLHRSPMAANSTSSVFATHNEEADMPTATVNETTPQTPENDPEGSPAPQTAPETQPAEVVGEPEEGDGGEVPDVPSQTPEGEPYIEEEEQARYRASFRIAGRTVSDFATVQSHIDALERFQRETRDEHRRNFVRQLAADRRIAGTQIDSLTEHALSLTDAQWHAFAAVYESAPPLQLFGNHGQGVTNPAGEDSNEDEIAVLEETVAMHRRSGLSDEALSKTASYRKLEALRATAR